MINFVIFCFLGFKLFKRLWICMFSKDDRSSYLKACIMVNWVLIYNFFRIPTEFLGWNVWSWLNVRRMHVLRSFCFRYKMELPCRENSTFQTCVAFVDVSNYLKSSYFVHFSNFRSLKLHLALYSHSLAHAGFQSGPPRDPFRGYVGKRLNYDSTTTRLRLDYDSTATRLRLEM